jgi:endonuclease/exonuclease/phosphatase family metal-dependent hydrolase
MRRRLLRIVRRVLPGGAVIFAGVSTVPLLTHGPAQQPAVSGALDGVPEHLEGPTDELVVMTLNLAHGRSNGFHQALQSKKKIVGNLVRVSRVIHREQPHVVAVQEADGPSLWSGQFDHVRFLAAETGFKHWARGEHVVGLRTRYGTGLLSRLPSHDPFSVTFPPSPPTLSKGFVVTTVTLPGPSNSPRHVDVVSIHLDFARSSVRRRQIQTLIRTLADRPNPRILMGDFNTDWLKEPSLRTLCEGLDLHAWKPEFTDTGTFLFSGKRLDWILTSPQLRFISRQVLPDTLSDHQAVVARLAWVHDIP